MSGETNTGQSKSLDSRWRELINQPDAAWKLAQLAAMLEPTLTAEEASDAINRAAELWHAGLERVELSLHLSESWNREMQAQDSAKDFLYCWLKRDDDSFRRWLTEAEAPQDILARGYKAHLNALRRWGLRVSVKRAEKCFALTRETAESYLSIERGQKAKKAAIRRAKKKSQKNLRRRARAA